MNHLTNLTHAEQSASALLADIRTAEQATHVERPQAAERVIAGTLTSMLAEVGRIRQKLADLRATIATQPEAVR